MGRKYNPKPKQAVALCNFLKHYRPKIGVELGVFWGETFFYLLDNIPELHLIGIDLWKEVDWGDKEDVGYRAYKEFPLEKYYQDVIEKSRKYGNRAEVFKEDTVEFSENVTDNTVDFVFIDADHTYNGVKRDIRAWLPKIKNKGFICGHDIHMDGVRKAVEENFNTWIELDNYVWVVNNDIT